MRRVGRPPAGAYARQLITISVDPNLLERFRKEAKRRKIGYHTVINEVLAQHVRKSVARRNGAHEPRNGRGHLSRMTVRWHRGMAPGASDWLMQLVHTNFAF